MLSAPTSWPGTESPNSVRDSKLQEMDQKKEKRDEFLEDRTAWIEWRNGDSGDARLRVPRRPSKCVKLDSEGSCDVLDGPTAEMKPEDVLPTKVSHKQVAKIVVRESLGHLWPTQMYIDAGLKKPTKQMLSWAKNTQGKWVQGVIRDPCHGAPPGVLKMEAVLEDGAVLDSVKADSRFQLRAGTAITDEAFQQLSAMHRVSAKQVEPGEDDDNEGHYILRCAALERKLKRQTTDSDGEVDFAPTSLIKKAKVAKSDPEGTPEGGNPLPSQQRRRPGGGGGGGGYGRQCQPREGREREAGEKATSKKLQSLAQAEEALTKGQMTLRMLETNECFQSVTAANLTTALKGLAKHLDTKKAAMFDVKTDDGNPLKGDWRPAELLAEIDSCYRKLLNIEPFIQSLHATKGMESTASFMHSAFLSAQHGGWQFPKAATISMLKREASSQWLEGRRTSIWTGFVNVMHTTGSEAAPIGLTLLKDDRDYQGQEQEKFIMTGLIDLLRPVLEEHSSETYMELGHDYVSAILDVSEIVNKPLQKALQNFLVLCTADQAVDEKDEEYLKAAYDAETKDVQGLMFKPLNHLRGGIEIKNNASTVMTQLRAVKTHKASLKTLMEKLTSLPDFPEAFGQGMPVGSNVVYVPWEQAYKTLTTIKATCTAKFLESVVEDLDRVSACLRDGAKAVVRVHQSYILRQMSLAFAKVQDFLQGKLGSIAVPDMTGLDVQAADTKKKLWLDTLSRAATTAFGVPKSATQASATSLGLDKIADESAYAPILEELAKQADEIEVLVPSLRPLFKFFITHPGGNLEASGLNKFAKFLSEEPTVSTAVSPCSLSGAQLFVRSFFVRSPALCKELCFCQEPRCL